MSSDEPKSTVTIVFATNRVEFIDRALRSADAQAPPNVEFVIIWNSPAASERLAEVARRACARYRPLRVVNEPRIGVAAAKNRGIREATTEFVFFLDDDVEVWTGWYGNLLAPVSSLGVGAAGGMVRAQWPNAHKPYWLPERLRVYYGERDATPTQRHMPFGLNLAVRRDAVAGVGGFREDLGHRGARPGLHEDTDLCQRLQRSGHDVVDAPAAFVSHHIRSDQTKLGWVLRRSWCEGRSDALRDHPAGTAVLWTMAEIAAALVLLPLVAARPSSAVFLFSRLLARLGSLVSHVGLHVRSRAFWAPASDRASRGG